MQEIQNINVKIFARPSSTVNWPALTDVFHRWIQDHVLDELLLDVADYAHVPAGPGIMLIGHDAFYSLDNRENRVGLLYNRRSAIEGSTEAKIRQAYDSAVRACRLLEQEPELRGLEFDERTFEIFVNDRMLAPNTESTWSALEPELSRVFSGAQLRWNGDGRDLFRVQVSA